jgi:hypothetical protein
MRLDLSPTSWEERCWVAGSVAFGGDATTPHLSSRFAGERSSENGIAIERG